MSSEEIDISVFVCPTEDSGDEEGDWRGVTRRDKYGFELEEDDYSESFIRNAPRSSAWEEKSQKVWQALTQNSLRNAPKSKIRNLTRKYGIPAEHRREVWWIMSNIEEDEKYNPETFKELLALQRDQNTNLYQEQIECDLRRTFPGHSLFDTIDGLGKLRRVLLAYSSQNPSVGYCQSMNFVCAFLLLVFEEEQAFWMLLHLIDNILPDEFYTEQMKGAVLDQRVFSHLIEHKLQRIHLHSKDIIHPISVATSQWFLCLFVGVLSAEITFHVWDLLFVDGFQAMFQISLALLKINEKDLLAAVDETDFFLVLKDLPRRHYAPKELIAFANNKFASIDNRRITILRSRYYSEISDKIEKKTQQRKQAAQRRKEALEKEEKEEKEEKAEQDKVEDVFSDSVEVKEALPDLEDSQGRVSMEEPAKCVLWPMRQNMGRESTTFIRIGQRTSIL